jgi:hypothetical protein
MPAICPAHLTFLDGYGIIFLFSKLLVIRSLKKDVASESCRITGQHSEELPDLCRPPIIVRTLKSKDYNGLDTWLGWRDNECKQNFGLETSWEMPSWMTKKEVGG